MGSISKQRHRAISNPRHQPITKHGLHPCLSQVQSTNAYIHIKPTFLLAKREALLSLPYFLQLTKRNTGHLPALVHSHYQTHYTRFQTLGPRLFPWLVHPYFHLAYRPKQDWAYGLLEKPRPRVLVKELRCVLPSQRSKVLVRGLRRLFLLGLLNKTKGDLPHSTHFWFTSISEIHDLFYQ